MENEKNVSFTSKLAAGSRQFATYALTLLALLVLASLAEVIYNAIAHQSPASKTLLIFSSLANTLFFWLKYLLVFWLIYVAVFLIKPSAAKWVIMPIFTLVVVVQV
ncbi:MAG: hypothetical protein EOO07_37830, partial [Chitinophagaceae bacterium]